MPRPRSLRLVVVGGGPAGLRAAIAAAEGGVDSAAVVERRRLWGEPVRCAELVSRDVERLADLSDECIASRIESLRWFVDGRERGAVAFPGFVLSRARFERHLAERAASLGVELLQPETATRVKGAVIEVQAEDGRRVLRAEWVIDQDCDAVAF